MRVQHKSNVLKNTLFVASMRKGWRVEIVYEKFGFVNPLGKLEKHIC